MNKKLLSVAIGAMTIVSLVGPTAFAQTNADLQAQIATLLAQIQALQGQLGTGGTPSTYSFTRDLTVGSSGADVKALQQFLNGHGAMVSGSGAGSPGYESNYFGGLTKAALAQWQGSNGISPAVGYFGPKTRAFIASMGGYVPPVGTTYHAGCTSFAVGTFSVSTGFPCNDTGTGTGGTPSAAGLSVSLASNSPASTNLAVSALGSSVNAPVLRLNFSAGATPVTVTGLVLTRSGLSQDSDFNNVYLYDGATRLATNIGFNNGRASFSNGAGLFTVAANTSKVITVTVDLANSGTSGHIFNFGLNAVADITANATFGGSFPITGAAFTTASVTNLATLTISGNATSAVSVNAGQTGYTVGQFTLQAGNNPVKVTSLRFTNVGSVMPNYLQNVKLMQGSTQLGATITALGSDNTAFFDLSSNPLMLTSGQTVVLTLYADITGGVGRTFQFSLQQASDVSAVDTMYGVGIGARVNSPATFPVSLYSATIANGGLVISRDAASPTTYAVAGNTNQVLAKFDVLASGDSIKFNELDFGYAGTATSSNFRVVDDQGVQLGTTGATVTSASGYRAGTGSLNYIIPANTTRVLTVYGDLDSGATGTVQVTLGGSASGGANSAQSYTTYSSVPISATAGNTLTVLAFGTNLLAATNYSLGSPVQAAAGATNVKVGSFTLTAGQVNGVNLTGVTLLTSSATSTANFRNLRVMSGTTPIGQTQPTVGPNTSYTFNSGAPIAIAANGSINIDVFADISSSITPGTITNFVTLTAVNASTASGNAVTTNTANGQNVTFNNGGAVTASLDASTPRPMYVGMNVLGLTVAKYRFTTDNNGSGLVTQLVVVDAASSASTTAAADKSTFVNYRLVDPTTGLSVSSASENSSGIITFNLAGFNVGVSAYGVLSLVADTNAYPYASSSGTHAFGLTSYSYTNASAATTTAVSGVTVMGNTFTVYRTSLNVTQGPAFTAPTSISGGAGQIVGEYNFVAGSGYDALVKTVTVSTAGTLVGASTVQVLGVYDSLAPSTVLATSTATSTNSMVFTLNASTSPAGWTVPVGQTRTLLVKIFSSPTGIASVTAGTGSYQTLLQGATWNDSVSAVPQLSPDISVPISGQSITGLSS